MPHWNTRISYRNFWCGGEGGEGTIVGGCEQGWGGGNLGL